MKANKEFGSFWRLSKYPRCLSRVDTALSAEDLALALVRQKAADGETATAHSGNESQNLGQIQICTMTSSISELKEPEYSQVLQP